MGTLVGVQKSAAHRIGVTLDDYLAKIEAGLKWCTTCKSWKSRAAFHRDASRGDGLHPDCIECRSIATKTRVLGAPSSDVQNAATGAVRLAILRGDLPAPRTQLCADCGEQAVQYHHHLGYEPEHRLDVVALCRSCHASRHWAEA